MHFETTEEHLQLIPALQGTDLSTRLRGFHETFGPIVVKFLASDAEVEGLGPVEEVVHLLTPPNLLRRLFASVRLCDRYTRAKRRAHRSEEVFRTEFGQDATHIHTQQLVLNFPFGKNARFNVRRVGSGGLDDDFGEGDVLRVVFATTGSDLIPFCIRAGYDWVNLWGDLAERLDAACAANPDYIDNRLQNHTGVIQLAVDGAV